LLAEAQRKLEAAENAQKEERRLRQEEQRKREAAENAQKASEKQLRNTTLPEFLDACHIYLHAGLTVQTDPTLSTQGDPSNANNKLRPEKILRWQDFPARQAAIWEYLMESDLVAERHFTSLHALETSGKSIRRRMMSSELDLHHFQRSVVEEHVSLIIEQLYNNRALRQKFGLQGTVKFENHGNTLSPESLEEGAEQMALSGTRRRSPRLLARARETQSAEAETSGTQPTRSSRPLADQFCVYNTSTRSAEKRVAAFILEFKAPHKLPLSYIYEGLDDMDLEDVVQCRESDTTKDGFRRLIAAVITQAFSYMVKIGSQYGCICTGEASIFLQVLDDPRTVYYFLSVPKGDVGPTTGWMPDSDNPNRLHATAVGQMLAFTLQALETPPRDQKWRNDAAAQLNSWEVVYEDLLEAIPAGNTPSSEYVPPRHNEFLRMSPIQLRRKPAQSCKEPEHQRQASDEEEPDPDTPSRQLPSQRTSRTQAAASSSSGRTARRVARDGQYCTQDCLRELVNGGLLDKSCPNMQYHGKGDHHQIDQPTFLALMRQQLAEDLDTNCEPVSRPGACGVLFRVRSKLYGYTVAAKATPIDFVERLRWEATVYEHLRPIQGIYVPVHLGNIDLQTRYFYEGIAELVHMMFLSFGGDRITQHLTVENRDLLTQQVDRAAQAIHNLGVLHKDLMPRNILWDEDTRQVMVVDFERAQVVKARPALGSLSVNRNGKTSGDDGSTKRGRSINSLFTMETQRAKYELQGICL